MTPDGYRPISQGNIIPRSAAAKKKAVLPSAPKYFPSSPERPHVGGYSCSCHPSSPDKIFLIPLLSFILNLSFNMFKLARSRPVTVALRAATVKFPGLHYPSLPQKLIAVLTSCSATGIFRPVPLGPATEKPVHPRIPVCKPAQIGASGFQDLVVKSPGKFH